MPVISLLGCAEPESTYYQIGFGLTGLSTLGFFFTFQKSILEYIPSVPQSFVDEKRKLKWSVLLCAIGVFGQGIITMEESAINGITGSADNKGIGVNEEGIAWKPGRQSIIHQLLAAVFFMAAMFHGWSSIQIYRECETEPICLLNKSKYFKMFTFGFPLIFQFAAFIWHPISAGTKSQNELNKAGLAQWLTVFSYLAFFASYSVDHISIQSWLKSKQESSDKIDTKSKKSTKTDTKKTK